MNTDDWFQIHTKQMGSGLFSPAAAHISISAFNQLSYIN